MSAELTSNELKRVWKHRWRWLHHARLEVQGADSGSTNQFYNINVPVSALSRRPAVMQNTQASPSPSVTLNNSTHHCYTSWQQYCTLPSAEVFSVRRDGGERPPLTAGATWRRWTPHSGWPAPARVAQADWVTNSGSAHIAAGIIW